MMDALLSIDVNPHLSVVGRDHRLPYRHLAQGPAPGQIGLKWEYVIKIVKSESISDSWERSRFPSLIIRP